MQHPIFKTDLRTFATTELHDRTGRLYIDLNEATTNAMICLVSQTSAILAPSVSIESSMCKVRPGFVWSQEWMEGDK